MRLNEVQYDGSLPIEGYGPGFFRIGGEVRQGPHLISAAGPQDWAGYDDRAPLLALGRDIDVLFIGTGAEIAPLPAELRAALEAEDVGVEIMASPTAARTYNVLLSEGRRIAAALLPVGGAASDRCRYPTGEGASPLFAARIHPRSILANKKGGSFCPL